MPKGSLIGQTLAGRFRLVELLGSGGMGEVYVAEHVTLGRRYAIKLLHAEIEADPIVAERFRREAQATSRLDHPNIVTISDFGKTESGQLYLVMEYIQGKNLYEVIEEFAPGRLPLRRSLNILAQVVRAVGAAHEAGVIHRDLKPDNTLLSLGPAGDDIVKILDFGLAKIVVEADLTALTKQGEVFGTPAYLSPEQALGVEIDHRTDIYSLGVMAYELCAGRLPFIAKSLPRLFIAHQKEVPQPPSAYVPAGGEPIPPRSGGAHPPLSRKKARAATVLHRGTQ